MLLCCKQTRQVIRRFEDCNNIYFGNLWIVWHAFRTAGAVSLFFSSFWRSLFSSAGATSERAVAALAWRYEGGVQGGPWDEKEMKAGLGVDHVPIDSVSSSVGHLLLFFRDLRGLHSLFRCGKIATELSCTNFICQSRCLFVPVRMCLFCGLWLVEC